VKAHVGRGDGGGFAYWRAPALPGIEFAEGRGPVATTEAPHFHAEGQAVLLLAGARLVERESRPHRLTGGEVIWIAPQAVHTTRALDGGDGAAAHFLHAYLPPALLRRLSPRRPVDAVRRVRPALAGDGPALVARLRAATSEAAALELVQALFDLGPAPAATEADAELADAVARAHDWLERHFAEPVSLEQLAEAAGLSRFHLLRAFGRRYGLTPHAWLLRRRVNHAKALLRAGASPAEAALASGFADQSHLGLHFRRLVGLTPAAYRRA
jgi:AraC-like DNA-binding protein